MSPQCYLGYELNWQMILNYNSNSFSLLHHSISTQSSWIRIDKGWTTIVNPFHDRKSSARMLFANNLLKLRVKAQRALTTAYHQPTQDPPSRGLTSNTSARLRIKAQGALATALRKSRPEGFGGFCSVYNLLSSLPSTSSLEEQKQSSLPHQQYPISFDFSPSISQSVKSSLPCGTHHISQHALLHETTHHCGPRRPYCVECCIPSPGSSPSLSRG